MEANSTAANETVAGSNDIVDIPMDISKEDYTFGVAGLIAFILLVVCVIAICIRVAKKTRKILKKQKKALMKKDSVSQALLGNKNQYTDMAQYSNIGFIDPNAYPYIPPKSDYYAYPSAVNQHNN